MRMSQAPSIAAPGTARGKRAGTNVMEEAAPVLRWNAWPTAEVPLTIIGQPGKWSFHAPFPCGSQEYVLLAPYERRTEPGNDLRVVLAADVRLPAAPLPRAGGPTGHVPQKRARG